MTLMPIHGRKTARKMRHPISKLNRAMVLIVRFVKKLLIQSVI
jgi:hypothetical protein